ncbi:hypothetical protein [Flavobacterium sp. 3HN19-14]|uniref:hypothetical protein n=1 Tax=Flavobacterium sp. 3HN19-14 TaxID=3448133 RepID=UPI003EE1F9A2
MPDSENLIFQYSQVALSYYQKDQLKNYDFTVANDTLIDGKNYDHYYLRSVKLKREKRKNLSILNWVIEPGTEYHLPLLIHPTAFAEWKSKPNLPNGIPKLYYHYNPNSGKISSTYTLLKITKIHKRITIPEGCEPFVPLVIRYRN